METFKTAGAVVLCLAIFAGFCALTYILLFKSRQSNMPNVGRGVGLCILAGLIKVLLIIAEEKVWSGLGAEWLNYPLIALLVIGILVMCAGLAEG